MSAWDMPGKPVRSSDAAGMRQRLTARDAQAQADRERAASDGFFDPAAMLRFLIGKDITIAIITTITAALCLAGVLLMHFPYKSSAIVFVDPRDEKVTLQEEVLPAIGTDAAALESMVRILGSDGFLIDLMQRLKLLEGGETWNGSTEQVKQLGKFRKMIDIQRLGATYLVEITVRNPSAEESARIANGIAEALAETQNGLRTTATENASRSLTDRLVDIRSKLNVSEEAVARFKAENNIVYLDEQNTVQTRQLTDISQQLAQIKSATEEAQARYDESQSTGTYTRGAGQDAGESEQLSFLRRQKAQLVQTRDQYRQIYGARHPRLAETQQMIEGIDRQIGQQRELMASQLKSERDVNVSKQAQLEKQLQDLSDAISRTDTAKVQLAALEREAAANREIYQQLLNRTKATYELTFLPTDNVRVVSPAVAPLASTRPPMMLLAPVIAFFSIAFAIVVVVLFNLRLLHRPTEPRMPAAQA